MPLATLESADDLYFSEPFKVIIRSCKEILLAASTIMPIEDRSFQFAHKNNFYAWLRGLGVDERLLWVYAVINDIKDPTKDFTYLTSLQVVSIDTVDSIISPLKTKYV